MSDESDVESMLAKWADFDSLTLQGLYVLMDVIQKEIATRTQSDPSEGPRLQLPEHPSERPCWHCRKWIKFGEQCVAFRNGKTYHFECHKEREQQ
jgi:hypothetical protein